MSVQISPLVHVPSLRELLELVAMLRDFRQPLGSSEGLRSAIDMLLKLGQALGVDPTLLARLRSLSEDPHLFELALAVLRYALSFRNPTSQSTISLESSSDTNQAEFSSQSLGFAEWFTLLMQLFELLRRLRKDA
ncbi:MAG: hypothetical protein IT427_13160 [Pirellulales bacterium]|nr:hypothetical protein [Pirellulales bacterium]